MTARAGATALVGRPPTEQLGRAEHVTVDMIGPTAPGMSACADEITTRYLLGDAPEQARVCTPDVPPFTVRD